jgi:hypothetical protein
MLDLQEKFMKNDNSAARLLAILERARKINPNTTCQAAWDALLDAQNDSSKLLSRMGKMIALPEQITSTLSNSSGVNSELLAHISDQFRSAFTYQKTNDKWSEFTTRIDAHLINYLGLASSLLEMQTQTKILSDEEINKLRQNFSDLLEEIRQNNISPRLKAYITQQIYGILSALDDYFITGAEPIMHKIESTVGHALVDKEYKNFLTSEELGKSLLDCLSAAANLVTVAVGIPQIAQLFHLIGQQ